MSPPPSPNFSTDELPILKKVADAYKAWHISLPHFKKFSRYTLGEKIDRLLLEVVELILFAGYAGKPHKLPAIQRASTKLDAVKFLLQLAWEIKAIDNKQYLAAAAPLAEVGKMLGGWQKQLSRP